MKDTIEAKKRAFFKHCRAKGIEPKDFLKHYCENGHNLSPFLKYSEVLKFVRFALMYFKGRYRNDDRECERTRTQTLGDWLHVLIFNNMKVK